MGRNAIATSEVAFHPTSYCDRHGRLFTFEGDLYRALDAQAAEQFKGMERSGLLDRLIERGLLIDTRATDLQLDGYALVVRHKRLPFVTYANEWCELMLRDVALRVVDLEMELAPHGLTVADAHPWNVLFDGAEPRYVDLGSIVPAPTDQSCAWDGYETYYRNHFLWPLMLMSRGHSRIARAFLQVCDEHLQSSDVQALLGHVGLSLPKNNRLRRAMRAVRSGAQSNLASRMAFLQRVRRETECQHLDADRANGTAAVRRDERQPKQQLVDSVLRDLHPHTVLDAGCGEGWYSELAGAAGATVVAVDRDERAVTECYRRARTSAAQAIHPVRMDLHFPAGGQGACNRELPPAAERLRCDMVLALDLIDALVAESNLDFMQIAETLAAFCNRWLLVEFVDPRRPALARHLREYRRDWYSLDEFVRALQRHFLEVKPLAPAIDGNTLLLCRKTKDVVPATAGRELATV